MAQPMAGPAVRTPSAGPLVRCAPDTSREELIRAICTWELLYKGWFTLPTTLHRLTVHLWQK